MAALVGVGPKAMTITLRGTDGLGQCLAVFWPRTPASPLADLMTEGTWLRRKATQENIRTKKGLLESTGNDISTKAPKSQEAKSQGSAPPCPLKAGLGNK